MMNDDRLSSAGPYSAASRLVLSIKSEDLTRRGDCLSLLDLTAPIQRRYKQTQQRAPPPQPNRSPSHGGWIFYGWLLDNMAINVHAGLPCCCCCVETPTWTSSFVFPGKKLVFGSFNADQKNKLAFLCCRILWKFNTCTVYGIPTVQYSTEFAISPPLPVHLFSSSACSSLDQSITSGCTGSSTRDTRLDLRHLGFASCQLI